MSSGMGLFVLSSLWALSWSFSRRSIGNTKYVSTLKKMFVPASGGSRHANAKSNEVIAEERHSFFSNLFYSSGLNGCKVIHVAGTKGKGSTVEFIAAGLTSVSDRVGVFTSPHLHTARERIKVGRNLISMMDTTRLAERALEMTKDCSWRIFFDLWLATALLHFSEQNVNYLVLETGIGGKYDSTNFYDKTDVCVITSISMDHQNVLGNTIEAIAAQKAGIIKSHSTVFTSERLNPAALQIVRETCLAKNAHLIEVPIERYGMYVVSALKCCCYIVAVPQCVVIISPLATFIPVLLGILLR
jgi:folylpolyglutamate synthase/dihydrofolate synthase